MTIKELIESHKELIKTMHRNGVGTDAVKWLAVYEDYCKIIAEGNKKTYAAIKVAEKYGYNERWVRGIAAFMAENVI